MGQAVSDWTLRRSRGASAEQRSQQHGSMGLQHPAGARRGSTHHARGSVEMLSCAHQLNCCWVMYTSPNMHTVLAVSAGRCLCIRSGLWWGLGAGGRGSGESSQEGTRLGPSRQTVKLQTPESRRPAAVTAIVARAAWAGCPAQRPERLCSRVPLVRVVSSTIALKVPFASAHCQLLNLPAAVVTTGAARKLRQAF